MDQPIFISNRAISRIPAVENWQRSYGRVLNITGDTGYGKTSYAAALAEQKLQESSQTNAFAGFAFCRGLTSSAIFRSLLWQFTQVGHTKHEQAQQVMQAFHRHSHSETDAGITSDGGGVVFREIYEKLLSDYDQVTLILDAVDQCRSQEHFIRHISRLASYLSRAQVKCRILLTSRIAIEWPEAEKSNISHQVIPITENEMIDDIIQYVSRSLQNLRPPVSESSQARILLKCSHVAGDGWPYAMHKMATEYLSEGRHIAAQRIEESVLDYRKDKFPEESIPTIECKRVLASALGDQGLYQEAEALQRQLLNTLRLKQSDSTLVHVIMSDLAHTLADSERWAEAKEVQLQLVDIWERGGPETVGQLRTGIKNLAITCSNLGELDEAERMLRQGLDRDIEAFGDNMDHESIVLDKINLGQILAQQEKWDEARVLQLSAVEASLRIFGLDSPITLNCMSNAAWALQQQGEYVEAKELQLEVVAGRTRMYGPDHPLTLKICGNLAATLGGLHEFDEARKYARRALGYYVAS
ncbi:kinesin light chain [Penicillium angulare]|uniref:kinesin light chain n=1 Tax=Penicillium angulare TaxID=116970 RepID=UPI00254006D2|nr:kinesin light chain [Penicillium angulare]KAJ5267553.1 kinesin light chain [Penicillium angulare]